MKKRLKASSLLPSEFRLERVVSGGQTGVDQAALDVAIELNIQHGGWCPRGRLSESGVIPDKYQLVELDSPNYADRTRLNVIDSQGTLVLYGDRLQGGSLLTSRLATQFNKPCYKVRLNGRVSIEACVDWIDTYQVAVLNVAGPRSSSDPKIYGKAYRFLSQVLSSFIE